ncbi:MAG TPA: hypothetical protein VFV93_01305 [Thermomicrobiales bacterium]|nr:hypothetical protein [Thermomicrobiales bacterium]
MVEERWRLMRAFWAALVVSGVMGVAGIVSLVAAMADYNSTLETYTQLSIGYEPESFAWVEPDFGAATTRIAIVNDSPADAVVENLNLYLRFDGEFAGTNYERFAPVEVPKGETRVVTLNLEVSTPSIQPEGGTAQLSLDGWATVHFDGVERELRLKVDEPIGVVPWEGP